MSVYKILFAGPVGAGKTTAIAALSDIETVTTEEYATDDVRHMKEKTTVAMDYGLMNLDGGEHIHLYGVPGQERFDFMWEILVQGGIGLVLMLNHENENTLDELEFYIGKFREFIDRTAVAVGVTRVDPSRRPSIDDYVAHLARLGLSAPVFEIDGRKAEDVATLVQSLLYTLDPGLKQGEQESFS